MKERSIAQPIERYAFADRKMAFVSGPRQCGKTTLAKQFLHKRKMGVYHNWDELKFRREWAQDPSAIIPQYSDKSVPLVVLDEIHKERLWKRNLKGVYDTMAKPCDILVTGSARLNVYIKGSDSLLGRHLSFRLHPFSVKEMETPDVPVPDAMLKALFSRADRKPASSGSHLASLMTYGPFPSPLFSQDERKATLWRRNREQLVIREDLRDLSRLMELGRIEMMTALLPEKVGSLFSHASLGRDLEVSIPTVKRWIAYLKELYYVFEVKPYMHRITRSLRREGKIYLWDYGSIKNKAARFENLVACHLLKTCHFWSDTGEGSFDLYFLRNKEKQEIDFLITRDGVPWLPVEVKQSGVSLSENWKRFADLLPCKQGLQIVSTDVWNMHAMGDSKILVAGAAEALRYFA